MKCQICGSDNINLNLDVSVCLLCSEAMTYKSKNLKRFPWLDNVKLFLAILYPPNWLKMIKLNKEENTGGCLSLVLWPFQIGAILLAVGIWMSIIMTIFYVLYGRLP